MQEVGGSIPPGSTKFRNRKPAAASRGGFFVAVVEAYLDAVLLWTFTRLGDGPHTGSSLPLPQA